MGDEVLTELNFNKEIVCKYQNFKYPNPEMELHHRAFMYHTQNLIQLIILVTTSSKLKNFANFLGNDQFIESVLQIADSNKLNAFEYAIKNKISYQYNYLLTIQGIKDYYNVNNDNDETNNALFRLLYTLFVDNYIDKTIDKILKELNISN